MTHKHKAEIYTGGALAIALVFLSATRAFSDPDLQQINAAVKACVGVSRAQENKGQVWHFDAYYNAATGRVHNNIESNFQVRFLYAFEKCMAERGFPLGSKDEGK